MRNIYHFIGMGGIGMSGLAKIALQKGAVVSGSDQKSSYLLDSLKQQGAITFLGHQAKHIPEEATVIYSTDIKEDNPEYLAAKQRGSRLLHRSEFLHELMRESSPLLVTGTHGKTTTTALLAHVLAYAKQNPSYCIGGVACNFQSQAAHGLGRWFVAEADESDGSFLRYAPAGAIITNIDCDHLPYWKTMEALELGFFAFAESVQNKEWLILCAEDSRLASLRLGGITYGFSPEADLVIEHAVECGWSSVCTFSFRGELHEGITVPLLGRHNVLNAAAVFALALQIGLAPKTIKEAIGSFQGVGRRAEKKGEARGILFYDDYAHHPSEIATTLQGFRRAAKEARLIAIFQPHRYTRVRDCFEEFGFSFDAADIVIVTDIYSAGESPLEGFSTDLLHSCMRSQMNKPCHYIPRNALVEYLLMSAQEGDLLVSLGAGDITHLGNEWMHRMNNL
ncbi:MAG: UDP-N-acetylmuramate--L-alanine ligase [Chlamydiae bacterium]|nr:UDP-N-acetylmuramate--L-alanine ligase [Chlamydiota bacterium]